MAYTMRATLYREASHVGKPYDPQSELRGGVALRAEEATPAELNTSGVMMEVRHLLISPFFHALPRPSTPSHALPMMEVRHPDLWDQRFELETRGMPSPPHLPWCHVAGAPPGSVGPALRARCARRLVPARALTKWTARAR